MYASHVVEDAVEAVVEVAEVDSKPNNLHYDQDERRILHYGKNFTRN